MRRLLIALSLTVATAAHAAYPADHYMDGNKLLKLCMSQNRDDALYCAAYLQGISDAMDEVRAELGVAGCTPGGTETSQLRDVVVKHLKDYAQFRQWSAATLASG